MDYRGILSAIAIALTFVAYVPYIVSAHRGSTKLHLFSWIVWGIATLIVFFAQLAGGGGVGAWPIGVTSALTLYVAVLSFLKRGDTTVTRADWIFFLGALSSLPLWYLASDPLVAVIVLTTVDVLGFGPTFRKAYRRPNEESLIFFGLMAVRNTLAALALEQKTLTTMLFPLAVVAVCLVFLAMVLQRRQALKKATN